MKDVYESFKAHLTERFSSPLFGAFTSAWLAWNHTYLFILFSSGPIAQRLALAKTTLFPTLFEVVYRGVVFPFLSAAAFILIYPRISKIFFVYWHEQQLQIANKRKEIEGLTMVTLEESNALRKDMLANQIEYQKSLHEKDTEIATLKSALVVANTPKSDGTRKIIMPDDKDDENNEGLLKVLNLLIQKNGEMLEHEISQKIKEAPIKIEYYLDIGIRLGFIERVSIPSSVIFRIKLTQRGREFVIKAKLVP